MSRRKDETERLREAFADRRPGAAGGGDRPDPSAVWDAVAGTGDAAERGALLDRTADDPELALEWRLARELQHALGSDRAEGAATTSGPRWRGAVALAAALVLAVTGAFLLLRPDSPSPYRDGEEPAVVLLLADGAALPIAGPRLRWRGPEGASYDLSVVRQADLVEIHRAEGVTASEAEIPRAALADLADGDVLLWRVEALLTDGSRVASTTRRLRVQRLE